MNCGLLKKWLSTVFACGLAWMNASADDPCPHAVKQDALTKLDAIIAQAPNVSVALQKELTRAKRKQANDELQEETVSDLIQRTLKVVGSSLSFENRKALVSAQEALEKCLGQYKITGYAFTVDPNGAFFVDEQDPSFDVYFQAPGSNVLKKRRYNASINSVGLKIQFAIKLNVIFFTDTAFDFYNSNKEIELGTGIDLVISPFWMRNFVIHWIANGGGYRFGTGLFIGDSYRDVFENGGRIVVIPLLVPRLPLGLDITYAPFKNAPGGIIMLGISLGLTLPGLSMVTGGKLTPAD